MDSVLLPAIRTDGSLSVEVELPFAVDQNQTFKFGAFRDHNPNIATAEYEGPQDHIYAYGSDKPTHELRLGYRVGEEQRSLVIRDYRGKEEYRPSNDLDIEWSARGPNTNVRILISDRPGHSGHGPLKIPEDIGLPEGIWVAFFGPNLPMATNYSDAIGDSLKDMLEDLGNLDFSESPFLPYRNISEDRLQALGKETVKPVFKAWYQHSSMDPAYPSSPVSVRYASAFLPIQS